MAGQHPSRPADLGRARRLIRDGDVTGLTSNPTIFEQAIMRSGEYDDVLRALLRSDASADAIVDTLVPTTSAPPPRHSAGVRSHGRPRRLRQRRGRPAARTRHGGNRREAHRLWGACKRRT